MKAGFAERDITPDLTTDRPEGIAYPRPATVHDACKARAAVFDDGHCRVALVGCDLESMLRSVVLAARAEIEAACAIPPECVLICGSHSHSAAFASIVEPGLFDHASELVKHLAYDLSACPSQSYVDFVRRQIVSAVAAADRNKTDAVCAVGAGQEGTVTFNRRFWMRDGRTFTNPGKGNPDIVSPAGPIDPEVGVLGAWDTEGRFLGCLVNFGCHGTTAPGGISADWVPYLERTARGAMGADAVVRIKRRVPNPARVQRAETIARRDPAEGDRTEWVFAKKLLMLDALIAKEPVVDVEAQAIQVGPAVFLGNPAELFCRHGLEIKAGSPFPFTFVVEMANGCVGYAPPEEEFGPHGGGLETRLSDYSNLEPTAGRQIVEASRRIAQSLTPGRMPEPEKAPRFGGPSASGAAPPELE